MKEIIWTAAMTVIFYALAILLIVIIVVEVSGS